MNRTRDLKGRWLSGISGNPRGRPRGATDKRRRFRFDGSRYWPCEKNLGDYAVYGGPGRPLGSHNRTLAKTQELLDRMTDAMREGRELSIPGLLRFGRAVLAVQRAKRHIPVNTQGE